MAPSLDFIALPNKIDFLVSGRVRDCHFDPPERTRSSSCCCSCLQSLTAHSLIAAVGSRRSGAERRHWPGCRGERVHPRTNCSSVGYSTPRSARGQLAHVMTESRPSHRQALKTAWRVVTESLSPPMRLRGDMSDAEIDLLRGLDSVCRTVALRQSGDRTLVSAIVVADLARVGLWARLSLGHR